MCGGGGGSAGPSQAELDAAARQRREAKVAQQEAAIDTAETKREDISEALTQRIERQGKRGGSKGRKSLFTSAQGAAGYLGRFD